MAKSKPVKFKGGKELKKLLDTALKGGMEQVEVGYFPDATYNDKAGTKVAYVAAIHQFGSEKAGIPERPFFSRAGKKVQPKLLDALKNGIDTKEMTVDKGLANKLGFLFSEEIKEQAIRLRSPKNKAATIKAKGSSNPLVDGSNGGALLSTTPTWETVSR